MQPDAVVEVRMNTTAEGGREGPVRGPVYGCVMFVDGEGFDCRLMVGDEELRLGERLTVEWHTENMPADALIPPLVLQPLVENAVYHGIEPHSEAGTISINIYKVRDEVHLVLRNPYRSYGDHHAGNKMAMGNIKERLALHFDAEARLRNTVSDNAYQVHIVIPYRRQPR